MIITKYEGEYARVLLCVWVYVSSASDLCIVLLTWDQCGVVSVM